MLAEAILEQAADAVIFSDREGLIERWNAAATQIFGYSREEAIGQSLDLIIPPPLREAHWRGYRMAMQAQRLRLGGKATLTKGLHQDGRKLYVEMSFALVLDADGSSRGSVAIARDVTERIERERQQRANP